MIPPGRSAAVRPTVRDVPPEAFDLARRYELLFAAAACVHFHLAGPTPGGWLDTVLAYLHPGPSAEDAYPLLLILTAGELLPMSQHITFSIILGKGRLRILAVNSLLELGVSTALALESAGLYKGVYHVLLGRISPLEDVEPGDLTIEPLMQRLASGTVREIIMGTNPTMEGDGTALYIQGLVASQFPNVQLTRLARGLPAGSSIEYANKNILADAISGRQKM